MCQPEVWKWESLVELTADVGNCRGEPVLYVSVGEWFCVFGVCMKRRRNVVYQYVAFCKVFSFFLLIFVVAYVGIVF